MSSEQIDTVTKSDIEDHIKNKAYLQVEIAGQFFKCRVGERSHMDGLFTKRINAERALYHYVGDVLNKSRKQIAKREANKNAKKKQS